MKREQEALRAIALDDGMSAAAAVVESMKSIVKLAARTDNRHGYRPPPGNNKMKKIPALILLAAIVSITVFAFESPQSSAKRRTPALTNDDLDAASASAPSPSENEVRLSIKERATPSGAIAWQRDLRRASEVARAEGKVIVADVYTDWCGWCHKMDETIYSDPAIVALSREQVFVKVNAEDRGEGQRFAQQMGVRGYPTTIVLDGQGRVLNIARGYIASPRAFGKMVQEALAQAR